MSEYLSIWYVPLFSLITDALKLVWTAQVCEKPDDCICDEATSASSSIS